MSLVLNFTLTFHNTSFSYLISLKQAVGFAISQAALRYALPQGVEVLTAPNQFGSLLEPKFYRDIDISCMYLVEDILDGMLVSALEVPTFQEPSYTRPSDPSMITPKKSHFKIELKSDFDSGAYVSTTKKVRKVEDYPTAKIIVTQMLGIEGDKDMFVFAETMYILRCLDTACNSSSLFSGLNHYASDLINGILRQDFKYCGPEVMKNKVNLLVVCESFLIDLNNAV